MKRGIGVLGAAAIGVGGMVGGGIFAVLGTAVSLAGGATPLAFLVAGALAVLTAYSYARLSVRYPESGGTVVFLDRAFGIDLATGVLNLLLWSSYLVTISLYAAAFGAYALTFFSSDAPWLSHILISAAIIAPAAINLLSADIVGKSETFVVVVKLALLAVVVAASLPHVDTARLAPVTWSGPIELVVGGMVIFVAYEGFELIANAAADVREPQRTLPAAYFGSVIFVIALYVLVAIVTVGSVSPERIAAASDYALAEAARPALGHGGVVMVSASALMATFSAINATIYGNARLGYTLALDGELPAVLDRRVWNRPAAGVLLTAGLSLLLANLVDLRSIAIMGSAGFLAIFAAVNAAAAKLSGEIGARWAICFVGAVACAAALAALLAHTYRTDTHALWILAAIVAAAVVFEMVYPRLSGRGLRVSLR